MSYSLCFVQDHVEVYDENGRFLFSADTQKEAISEMNGRETA